MEACRNNESSSDSAQQQFALLDMLIPGFSLFVTTVQSSFAIDLRLYIPILLIIGSSAWIWSHVWEYIKDGFDKYLMSSMYIRTDDEVFNIVMGWVAQQNFSRDSHRFIPNTNINSRSWMLWDNVGDDDEEDGESDSEEGFAHKDRKKNSSELKYTPSYGTSFFTYHGHLLLFIRTEDSNRGTNLSASEREIIQISCFGRNPAVLKDLLLEARQLYLSKDQSKTIIYRGTGSKPNDSPSWKRCVARFSRPFSTILLNEEIKQRVIDDVADYIDPNTRRWYANRGIPYRRGYLFYGPPGTGKSSLSFALAGFFQLPIYIISLSSPVATEENVSTLFGQLPRRCIVLLEDIDSAGVTHNRVAQDGQSSDSSSTGSERLSLSGLLNVLDGVASQEGRVLIMTTNHLEKLDSALVRPGRVDLMVEFSLADEEVAASIFRAIYTPYEGEVLLGTNSQGASPRAMTEDEKAVAKRSQVIADIKDMAMDFAAKIPQGEFSPAEIQGLLLQHKRDPLAAIQGVDPWIKRTREERAKRRAREAEKLKEEGEKKEGEVDGKIEL
ncbi:unnamed protein product [Clonostachys rosea]|uniref:AAA+ ATPase domain-containing protein n=1 Tax=Bionectria ochroleuca TaxID=29856 RepID=A0ABY6U7F8_BIOOC|nr:unnamed protein product [Clonostachys rosea]